jgi:hypothetical protein
MRLVVSFVHVLPIYNREKNFTNNLKQAGEYYTGDSSIHITSPSGTPRTRRRGPNFECTGHSIFGYFLPLMTILGEIVDLYHAKNHPRFGVGFRSAKEWDDHASEITRQLEIYGQSLKDFEARHLSVDPNLTKETKEGAQVSGTSGEQMDAGTPSAHSVHTVSSGHLSEADIQTRIVVGKPPPFLIHMDIHSANPPPLSLWHTRDARPPHPPNWQMGPYITAR